MKENIDPRMHTAEHILNQTMIRLFSCGRAFSAHIEKKKSKCDYRFDRALSDGEIKELEEKVNRIIQDNLEVSAVLLPLQEVRERLHYDKPLDGDPIRAIQIGDYDIIPCYGDHVGRTGEVGGFRIVSSDWNEGVLRIRYKLS